MAIKRRNPSSEQLHWTPDGSIPTHHVLERKGHNNVTGSANGNSTASGSGRPALRIAVIGAGLAGSASAIALSRLPNVELNVYERSESVREVGAMIGIMVSAMKSLSRILSPEGFEKLQSLLYRGENLDGLVNRFWRTGEVMTTQISPHTRRDLQEGRTGRVALHELLLSEIPAGAVHYGKKVVNLEKKSSGYVVIHFEDGTTAEADLVVAADGLYSKIRKQYNPDETISYRNRTAYRYNFPVSLVKHIKNLPPDSSAWRSSSQAVFLSPINPGYYSFLAFIPEPEEFASTLKWAKSIGKPGIQHLKEKFAGWDPVIQQVLDVIPDVDSYPLQNAPWMDKLYQDDAVVFVGDAAHPTSGDYGGGCSFAFADVRALYLSLWRTYDPERIFSPNSPTDYNLPYALHLYNETRIYFLKRVKRQMSHDVHDFKYLAGAGDDDQEFIRRYRERFTINWWLLDLDVDERWQEVEAEERVLWHEQQEASKKAKVLKTVRAE